ncbi:MAG: hypothetical protein FJY73_00085 [Candidatus Eisenbacteria bacterium]|nr:hypothetical protein [Candidatus Eisenbacteria bacterium]
MSGKNGRQEVLASASRVEEHSTPNGEYRCIVCGMRYRAREHAEICCKKIAGIENLGGRRQHRWR